MPTVLFWFGIGATFAVGLAALFEDGEDKRDTTALPFILFLGAAVAKYLGM